VKKHFVYNGSATNLGIELTLPGEPCRISSLARYRF
jgi:hypothetical protein